MNQTNLNKPFKDALNFLLYDSLKITSEDLNSADKILEIAIDKAYRDATMQAAFNALVFDKNSEADLRHKVKEKVDDKRKTACQMIRSSIRDLSLECDYDIWHKKMCNALESHYKDIKCTDDASSVAFSFGNAQKWINMTMKYLYLIDNISLLLGGTDEYHREIGTVVQELAPQLHIPVDSYIIEEIWYMECDKKVSWEDSRLPIVKDNLCRNNTYGKYSSEKVKSWSTWSEENYETFRAKSTNPLKEFIGCEGNLIDWEADAWLQAAKKRSSKK